MTIPPHQTCQLERCRLARRGPSEKQVELGSLRGNVKFVLCLSVLISLYEKTEKASIDSYEVLEPRTANTLVQFTNTPEKSPAITVNNYGKGRAIYVAVPAQMAILSPLVRSLNAPLAIGKGPETPSGVYAREDAVCQHDGRGENSADSRTQARVVSGEAYERVIRLKPYDVGLVQ